MHNRIPRNFLRLIALAVVALAVVTACELFMRPGEEDQAYLDLLVEPPVGARLIDITYYDVTSLRIQVAGPDGTVIQAITWVPDDGTRRYRIPVEQLGDHEVTVAHRSRTSAGQVEAVESQVFAITPMIITEVRIVPGAVGYILVDSGQRVADLTARQLLPELVAETPEYVVTRMPAKLPAGTTIVEDLPEGVLGARALGDPLTLAEDSYLYYLDLQPGAYYEHPVKYIIVSESGEKTVVDAQWWPRVNNEVPQRLFQISPDLNLVLERTVILERPPLQIVDIQINPGIIQLLTREAYVCVQGLLSNESLYPDSVTTYQNSYNFFDAYRPSFSTVVGLADYDADSVLTEIDSLAADGYDIITIYIIAHGGTNYVRLGGVYITASQFAATMSSHPDVQFNFLCGACHSGSFVDDLATVDNVRVVETACATTESAWPDKDLLGGISDTNAADTGSEWTSSWIEAAQVITSDSTLWTTITSRATNYGVPATSVLLNEAGYLGAGQNRGLATPLINYDLTFEVGWSTPQHYNSWEVVN